MNDAFPLHWPRGADLLPAIVQDSRDGTVLMLAYMNEESFTRTLATGRVTFFSRSRQRLWEKGETSGNELRLVSISLDCDADTLLVLAVPRGPTCHLNTRTCWGDAAPRPQISELHFLLELEAVIAQRLETGDAGSYVQALMNKGTPAIAQKVGEEAVEVVIAALAQDLEQLTSESADLLFHLLILLRARGLSLQPVVAELARRHSQEPRSVPPSLEAK